MVAAVALLSVAVIALVVGVLRLRRRAAAAEEIAARHDAEHASRFTAVESSRAALREILDGLGEGLLALDRERRVVLANERFREMFRVQGDVERRALGEVIRAAAVFDTVDRALKGGEATERFVIDQRRIEIRAMPLTSDIIAAVALFIDATQLERLEQIRRDFISDFTHEVRTPLAGLASAVESYAMGQMSADDDHQLRRIMTRQLRRLQRLVDGIAELSSIETGDLLLDRRELELRSLLDDLREEFAERASQKRIRMTVSGDRVKTFGDEVRMQQLFSNLLDNAIKYGGEDNTVDISVAERNGHAVVSITDHGEGIAADEHERIFRRLYRVDKSRSQETAGSGLGLAIAKHLVLLHNGSIDVESEPGKGATFVVRLPRA